MIVHKEINSGFQLLESVCLMYTVEKEYEMSYIYKILLENLTFVFF